MDPFVLFEIDLEDELFLSKHHRTPLPGRERGRGEGARMKHYPHYIIDLSRELRKRATTAEKLLWEHLRNRKLDGLKFRRQHHFGRYISDFYCAELFLVIELEGGIHERKDQREYDEHRDEVLESRRLTILKFKNE